MRWCRGCVRIGRVASLSSRYNSRKAQPFGIHFDIHFDIGFCGPIPSNVNLKKERPVCISFTLEGHGGEVGWGRHVLHHYLAGIIAVRLKRGVRVRKSRIKREREKAFEISWVSIYDTATTAVHYLSPTGNCILQSNTSSQPNGKFYSCFLHGISYHFIIFSVR
jgi:hypothetical protein